MGRKLFRNLARIQPARGLLQASLLFSFTLLTQSVLPAEDDNLVQSQSSYLLLMEKEEFEPASRLISKLRAIHPEDSMAPILAHFHFHLGLSKRRSGNYTEALRSLEEALRSDPENQEILLALADTYLENHQYHDAIQVFHLVLSRLSEERRKIIIRKIALAWSRLGEYPIAINELRAALLQWPDDPETLGELARLSVKSRSYAEAMESLEKLSRIQKLSPLQAETYRQAKESVRLQSSYDENYSANFHVWIQDQKVGHHRHEILQYLETVYSDVGSAFSFYPRQLTRVSLLSSTDFQDLAKLPEKVIGLSSGISQEIQIPLARVHNLKDPRQLKNTLYHEYSHHLIRLLTANHPSVPVWFHEGVASYMEPYRNTRHDRSILLKLLASGELADESSFQGSLYKHSNSSDLYLQAGSVIAYLEERELLIPLLKNLKILRSNRDFLVLFQEITGWTITELFNRWKGWISEKSRSSLARGR